MPLTPRRPFLPPRNKPTTTGVTGTFKSPDVTLKNGVVQAATSTTTPAPVPVPTPTPALDGTIAGVPVSATPPTDAQIIQYNAGDGLIEWGTVNGDVTLADGAEATVQGIQGTEVSATPPTNAQFFLYNSSTQQYTPVTLSQDGSLADTGALTITGIRAIETTGALNGSTVPGDYLFNGTNLVPVMRITIPPVYVVANSNITLSGNQTIDGVTLPNGIPVLCIAQTTGSQNGPWITANAAWARPPWYPNGASWTSPFLTLVRFGATYANQLWQCVGPSGFMIGTQSTSWKQVWAVNAPDETLLTVKTTGTYAATFPGLAADASSGDVHFTLPDASTYSGSIFVCLLVAQTGSYAMRVDAAAGQTVNAPGSINSTSLATTTVGNALSFNRLQLGGVWGWWAT